MSSVIGSLRVNLGLDSAQFSSGAKKADKALVAMKKQFLAVAGAALALGAGISAFAIKGANDIDYAAKSARRLGTSIGGFRALEMAAGEAGVSLSSLTNDVQTMDREIAKGSKGAAESLNKLGISAGDLAGLEADQKIALIADQIQKLGLDAGQASVVLQGLGVRNREMVLAVLSGGDAFRKARKDAEDYGLAVSAVDSAAIEQANDRIGRLGYIGQYAAQQLAISLVPTMGAVAKVMTDSLREGGLLRTMIDGLVDNIDTLAASVGVLIGVLGIKLVAAMAVSLGATSLLTGAFVLLRAAIFATGFGALVIGAGWAVAKFMDLVKATGGFGEALGLIKDVAKEVWDRIKMGFTGLQFQMAAGWLRIKANALETFGDIAVSALENVNTIVGAFVGAKDAIIAAWEALPSAFANIGARAINALIDKISSGISAVIAPVNAMLEGVGLSPIAAPDLSEWRVVVGEAAVVGGKAKAAFDAAMSVDYSGAGSFKEGIGATVADMRAAGDMAAEFALGFKRAAAAPLTSVAALQTAVTGVTTETQTATDAVVDLGNALDDAGAGSGGGGKGGKSVDGLKDKVKSLKESANEMKDTFRTAFKDLATGAKNFGDVVKDVLGKIADRLLDSAFDNLWGAFSGGGTKKTGGGFLGSLLGGIFGSAKGNVFSGGSPVKAFANGGIVNGPTLFPMRGAQTGLMGEAGPEAIVPLSRGRNGKLGIQSQGGGVAQVQVIGGDLTLSDNGSIMARVQVMDAQTANKAVGQAQSSFRNSKQGWSP